MQPRAELADQEAGAETGCAVRRHLSPRRRSLLHARPASAPLLSPSRSHDPISGPHIASLLPALTSLALAHCHMGANGAKSLAKALLDCPLLQSLDVTDNSLGTQGLSHLGTWLRSACSTRRLHTVCLGFNELGDEGAQRLAKLLRGHVPSLSETRDPLVVLLDPPLPVNVTSRLSRVRGVRRGVLGADSPRAFPQPAGTHWSFGAGRRSSGAAGPSRRLRAVSLRWSLRFQSLSQQPAFAPRNQTSRLQRRDPRAVWARSVRVLRSI
eukprot:1433455-Rhodomonas_salina.5